MTKRRLVGTLLALALALGLVAAGSGAAGAGEARNYVADASQYNGATSDLGFYLDVSSKGHLRNAWLVEASLDLPARYANAYCARAEIRVNGLTRLRDGYRCDTNGDARLEWFFGDLWLHRGDRVSVWFSDAVTRWAIRHPEIVV